MGVLVDCCKTLDQVSVGLELPHPRVNNTRVKQHAESSHSPFGVSQDQSLPKKGLFLSLCCTAAGLFCMSVFAKEPIQGAGVVGDGR